MIRVGLIGVGKMGSNHARVLENYDGVDFVGFFDPNVDQEALGAKKFPSEQALIQECQALIVANPSSHHADSATLILSENKTCLIEKPLATSKKDVQRIESAATLSEGKVFVGMIERFNPAVALAKSILQQGAIGDLMQISTIRQGPRPTRINDVGVDLDLAVHDLDLASYLGQAEFVSLSKESRGSQDRSIYPDYFCSVGELESGTKTSHVVNWMHPIKKRSITIFGSRAVLELDLLRFEARLVEFGTAEVSWPAMSNIVGASRGQLTDLEVPLHEPLQLEIAAFLDSLNSDSHGNIATLKDASKILDWLVA